MKSRSCSGVFGLSPSDEQPCYHITELVQTPIIQLMSKSSKRHKAVSKYWPLFWHKSKNSCIQTAKTETLL